MARVSGEALVISALLNIGDVEAAQRYGVSQEHFRGYAEEYRWLLNYLKQYAAQPTWEVFQANFPDFLQFTHDDVRSAVDTMLVDYHKRHMVEAIDRASLLLADKDVLGAYEILKDTEPVFTSAQPREVITDMSFLDDYHEQQATIRVPSPTLDRVTGGIGRGQLWYLGARTNHGKSAHLCDWVVKAVRDGWRVKFYSLEMTEMEVRARIHAILANKFGHREITAFGILHRAVDPAVYKAFIEKLGNSGKFDAGHLHVHTPAQGAVTPGVIAASITDYDLVVVDHVGLMRPDGTGHMTDDWRVAAKNSNMLMELALSSMTPILGAAQINREGAFGKGPPDIKNLAGTDALGQDASVVVTLRTMSDVASVFWTPKNRNGPKGRWYTKFDVDHGDFAEINQDTADLLEIEALSND